MGLKINEVAKLTGITVRILHYYDEIGLLKPNNVTQSGYRIYEEQELEVLQQILFFRELDFSLCDIKEIMGNTNYNKTEALDRQRQLLIKKRNRLNGLIDLVEQVIGGDNTMSFKEFDTTKIEENKKKYAAEIKERWGKSDAYAESEQKTKTYGEEQWNILNGEWNAILLEFAENRHFKPDSKDAQNLVKKWQDYITKNFYTCTNEILSGLGKMYVGDERFTQNIDKNGEGTAEFMADAIAVYCSK